MDLFEVKYSDVDRGWVIDRRGNIGIGPTYGPYSRKTVAVSEGRKLAKANRPAKLVVYKMGGEKDLEHTYERK